MATEKFALRWNDFESNIFQAMKSLRDDRDLCDVSLACEDDVEVEAHKLILASSSPFFEKIFKKCKNKPALLYLKGVTSHVLKSLLTFMYLGQVSVAQEELNSFLLTAEDLQVRGLSRRDEERRESETDVSKPVVQRNVSQAQQISPVELVKSEEFAEDDSREVYEEDEYLEPDGLDRSLGSTEVGWDHDTSNKGIVTL